MKPNVIFVLLDGTRWDRLHTSEEFQKLKKQGVLFSNVTATAPYTFAAMNGIFTGRYGKDNGVNAYYKMFKLKDSISFLPEVLHDNGYFTACDLITEKVISSRGFDVYQAHDEYKDDLNKRHPELLKRLFQESKNKPVFCFLQFSRIHTVTVSEVLKKYEWDDKEFYQMYDKNLEKYDKVFGEASVYANKIKQTIEELNQLENTILVFFSDHGTGVGERFGERNYGVYLYEETIRTIYLFLHPSLKKNQEYNQLFSAIDVFPTILDMLDINVNHVLPGNSFASFLTGNTKMSEEDSYTFSETGGLQGPHPSPKEPNVFCIKNSRYKLIFFKTPNKYELYDLKKDPLEKNNLYGHDLEIEEKLVKNLNKWIKN